MMIVGSLFLATGFENKGRVIDQRKTFQKTTIKDSFVSRSATSFT